MTRKELEVYLLQHEWTRDTYGHFHKGTLRFHLGPRVATLQREYRTPDTEYHKGELRYLKLDSAFYSKISVNPENGKLKGFTK
jgi:hypothetical protein